MESRTSNLLLRTTWNSFVYCMLVSGFVANGGLNLKKLLTILEQKYFFLDSNLYYKMNCDILIFSDRKNVLFGLEMCLSTLIPKYVFLLLLTYMDVRKVLVHVWCFYTDIILHSCSNHNWFSKEFQIISAAPITVWQTLLSSWIFPYFI